MNSGQAGALAATIAVPIVMALLAKAMPAKQKPVPSGESLESLTPKYSKWENRLKFVYLFWWGPITAAICYPLQTLSDWHAELLGPADYRLTPGPVLWLLPSFFASLALSVVPTEWIAKKLLGTNFDEYRTYILLKTKYDLERANRAVFWFIGISCTLFVALGLDFYVIVRPDALVTNPFLGFGETVHAYSDVQAIQTAPRLIAPNGNVVRRREFLVTFRDGEKWSTNRLPPTRMSESEKKALVELLSKRSNVPIDELQVFQNGAL